MAIKFLVLLLETNFVDIEFAYLDWLSIFSVFSFIFLICIGSDLWWFLQDLATYIRSHFLFEFDLEIEKTFRSRRKKLKLKEQIAKA